MGSHRLKHRLASVLGLAISIYLHPIYAQHSSESPEVDQPLAEVWTLDGIFNDPESAAYDPNSDSVFISNVNNYAKDNNGFVSRVTQDGKQVELKWLDGINSPTGLTAVGGTLYVVDYDALLEVDIETATITQRFLSPHDKPALNDVVVTSGNEIFVSGSASNSIYKLVDNKLIVWKQDDKVLKRANGLFEHQGVLFFGGEHWLAFSVETGARLSIADTGLRDIDGIASDGCGGMLVTLLDDKRIWQIKEGQARPRSQQAINGIDLSYHDGRLLIPRVGNSVTVYQVDTRAC